LGYIVGLTIYQYIKYIILEFTPSIALLHTSPSPLIPGTVSMGIISAFTYMFIHYLLLHLVQFLDVQVCPPSGIAYILPTYYSSGNSRSDSRETFQTYTGISTSRTCYNAFNLHVLNLKGHNNRDISGLK
jgi:hypothetical protein